MKYLTLLTIFAFMVRQGFAQRLVFDPGHLEIVNSNGATRLAAELSYQASLQQIHKNTDDIGINLTSVSLVQTMIHRSLTEVNEALKDAIQVKQMGYLINDIYRYSSNAMELAKGNPTLLLFAEDAARQLKVRGLAIVNDVSTIILQSKGDVMMNYNVRDELIRKVVDQLQIINALAYQIWQNMYWAKLRGVVKSINPYGDYFNRDFAIMNDIINKRKMLN